MNAPLSRDQRNALRRQEADRLRSHILDRCRALMVSGHFRPTATEIVGKGGEHAIANRFGGLPSLYEEALDDDTARRIVLKVLHADLVSDFTNGDFHRLARAAVFGRLST